MKRKIENGLSPLDSLALIESFGIGTWTWDLDNSHLEWSAGISRILGIDHLPGSQTLDLFEQRVHPDDKEYFRNPAKLSWNGVSLEMEYRILRPDGELRWVRSANKLIHSADGRPDKLAGVTFDITDARRGLQSLKEREALLVALRELFDVVTWSTDGDGTVANQIEWRRSTGQPGRVDEWRRLDAVHPEDRQRVRDAWEEAIRTRKRYLSTFRVLWGSTYVPVVSRAVAVLGPDGDIQSWVGFTRRQDSVGLDLGLPEETKPSLAPGQVRAARGYLGWSAEQLAEKAGVSFSTVRRVETPGERGVRDQSLLAIRRALERAGIQFATAADGRTSVSMK